MSPSVWLCWPQRESQTTQPWVKSFWRVCSTFFFSFCNECSLTCARWVMFNLNRYDVGLLVFMSQRPHHFWNIWQNFEACIFTPIGQNVYLGNAWILYRLETLQGISINHFFVQSFHLKHPVYFTLTKAYDYLFFFFSSREVLASITHFKWLLKRSPLGS